MLRRTTCLVILLLLLGYHLCAQQPDQNTISAASLTVFPPPNFYLDVHFTNSLADPDTDLVPGNVTITTTPSPLNPPLAVGAVERLPGTRKGARVTFTSGVPASITDAHLCFNTLTFVESSGPKQAVTNVCGAAQILNPTTAAAAKDQLLQELRKIPKTQDEKNIFASGFVTTASSGSQGGVDLNLNSNDLGIPGMTAFLHMKKTTAPGGDPKNLEVGTNFRKAYVWGGADLDKMRKDINTLRTSADNTARTDASQDLDTLQESMQARLLSAVLVDLAGKLEGGATDFNVANYVGEGDVQLQSRTKTLFGSKRGFWQFRFLPFGIEGGKNIQNDTTTSTTVPSGTIISSSGTGNYVARYKGGGVFTLLYDDPESPLPFKRLQMNLSTVHRYLFFKESEVLSAKAAPVFRDGHRPWYQADVNVYLAEAPSGRYGVRLTYNNGSLPPAFTQTKSFQFGFVFETADGESKKSGQ